MFWRKKRELVFESAWIRLYLDDVVNQHHKLLKYNVVHAMNESVVAAVKKGNFFDGRCLPLSDRTSTT